MTDFAKLVNDSVRRRRSVKVVRSLPANQQAVFFALLSQEGLPLPTPEYRFAAPRRWRFDYAWLRPHDYDEEPLLALEVDGATWANGRHTRGSGWLKDTEKLNEAACRGWRMLRCTPKQLCSMETVTLIQRALSHSPL